MTPKTLSDELAHESFIFHPLAQMYLPRPSRVLGVSDLYDIIFPLPTEIEWHSAGCEDKQACCALYYDRDRKQAI